MELNWLDAYTDSMENFEHRRDRFEAFSRFDNPLINISMTLTLPAFRPFCKARQLPPFHVFLYYLGAALAPRIGGLIGA